MTLICFYKKVQLNIKQRIVKKKKSNEINPSSDENVYIYKKPIIYISLSKRQQRKYIREKAKIKKCVNACAGGRDCQGNEIERDKSRCQKILLVKRLIYTLIFKYFILINYSLILLN